jgi:hypothetical protein
MRGLLLVQRHVRVAHLPAKDLGFRNGAEAPAARAPLPGIACRVGRWSRRRRVGRRDAPHRGDFRRARLEDGRRYRTEERSESADRCRPRAAGTPAATSHRHRREGLANSGRRVLAPAIGRSASAVSCRQHAERGSAGALAGAVRSIDPRSAQRFPHRGAGDAAMRRDCSKRRRLLCRSAGTRVRSGYTVHHAMSALPAKIAATSKPSITRAIASSCMPSLPCLTGGCGRCA